MREQIDVPEHHADAGADLVDIRLAGSDLDIVDPDVAPVGFVQAVYASQQRGFAGAGRTAYDDLLTAADIQGDVAKNLSLAKPFAEPVDLDHRRDFLRVRPYHLVLGFHEDLRPVARLAFDPSTCSTPQSQYKI